MQCKTQTHQEGRQDLKGGEQPVKHPLQSSMAPAAHKAAHCEADQPGFCGTVTLVLLLTSKTDAAHKAAA